jgi:hypothetical protein
MAASQQTPHPRPLPMGETPESGLCLKKNYPNELSLVEKGGWGQP